MIDFLHSVPFGSIIIIAVYDSGRGKYFSEDDVAYLEKLGAGGYRCPVKIGLLLKIDLKITVNTKSYFKITFLVKETCICRYLKNTYT